MSLPEVPELRCWHRRIPARAVPMRLFEALYADESLAFLYESLEAHGGRGRYSFIGSRPRAVFKAKGRKMELRLGGQTHAAEGNPLDELRRLVRVQTDAPPLAPFCGGAVGLLSYDAIRHVERLPDARPDQLNQPDAFFLIPQEVICFDHLEKIVHVLLYLEEGHEQRLKEIQAVLPACQHEDVRDVEKLLRELPREGVPLESNMSREQFERMVTRAKEYIQAGDIFQVVLSQRFSFPLPASPLQMYKALRLTNPSPYMYYLRLDGLHVAGSSPEILVKLVGRKAVTRPLAGTRPRGQNSEEDTALAAELQADPKERAEHVMLVDLGRNDLGRVCEYGSVKVTGVLEIERHSKVMHLVSNVEGWLADGRDGLDLFRAVFPAGTVSGAPKVRAMEIIDELEPSRRGIYAGAIGYFSLLGDVDLCIAIRTLVMQAGRGYIQAGAGIVADSIAEREYEETLNKARGLLRAVQLAAGL